MTAQLEYPEHDVKLFIIPDLAYKIKFTRLPYEFLGVIVDRDVKIATPQNTLFTSLRDVNLLRCREIAQSN